MEGRLPSPLVGGYYWFPSPLDDRTAWAVLTCHDLRLGPDVGHVDLWPAVVDRLAEAWGRSASELHLRLIDHNTDLPWGGSPDRGGRC